MSCDGSGADYVRGINPIWYLVNQVGNQFDDTYYLWVLENQVPYVLADVYHTPSGTVWAQPIQFLQNGTLPINIFFNPNVVYRLEFRKNDGTQPPSQNDELIYLVENYSPTGENLAPVDTGTVGATNQVANPQFAEISFISPYTLSATNPAVLEIAPGWLLELTGTGTLTAEQTPLNNALSNPTNAPYALHLVLNGWTTARLIQRFSQNGMLWANKYVALSFTARIAGVPQNVTSRLVASNGQPLATLNTSQLSNSFVEYRGFAQLPATLNPDLPPDAYIEYQMLLPTSNADLFLTSFQLAVTSEAIEIAYEQDSVDRQIDHLFHVYKPQLEYKPIPSYLVGWDFALNPTQFEGPTVAKTAIGANKSKYVWDQTIIFQSADDSVAVARAPSGGLRLTADGVATQMAVIQYLDQDQAREILQGTSSVALRASCSSGDQDLTISLWSTTDVALPDVSGGNNDSIVATLNADGSIATRNGTWVALSRNNPGNVTFPITATPTDYMFGGWIDDPSTPHANTATFFAIVISTDSIANAGTITLEWVSLCAGEIATRPAPKTADETLRECEQYYEMSYESAADIGTATSVNALMFPQSVAHLIGTSTQSAYLASSFFIPFRATKRVNNPRVSIYSNNTGVIDTLDVYMLGQAATHTQVAITRWTPVTGNKYVNYLVTNNTLTPIENSTDVNTPNLCSIGFQYVADARLGIV